MSGTDLVLIILQIFGFLILARVIELDPLFTQRPLDPSNPIIRFIFESTEPILGPLRRYLMVGMIDLSPLIVLIVIQALAAAVANSA